MEKDPVEQSFSCTHGKRPGREEFFLYLLYVKEPGSTSIIFPLQYIWKRTK
jgi:hypothetical protein